MSAPLPPPHELIADKDGRMNDVWYRFFEGNFTALDSAEGSISSRLPSALPVPVAEGGTGQITEAEAIGELTQALTEDTSPDRLLDFVGTYDASADTGKKVTLSRVTGAVVLATGSVSDAATLDVPLDTTGYSTFKLFRLVVYNGTVVDDDVQLYVRFSDDGGGTFEADAADYGWEASDGTNDASDSEIQLNDLGVGNASGEGFWLDILIYNPAAATQTRISWNGGRVNAAGSTQIVAGAGTALAAAASTDIRLLAQTGNLSCSYTLLGII